MVSFLFPYYFLSCCYYCYYLVIQPKALQLHHLLLKKQGTNYNIARILFSNAYFSFVDFARYSSYVVMENYLTKDWKIVKLAEERRLIGLIHF